MKTDTNEKIVILGISENPARYSFKAYQRLLKYGFSNQVGVSPRAVALDKLTHVDALEKVDGEVHTLTLYVGIERLNAMIEDIIALAPKRIITNPGTENPSLIAYAREKGIEVVEDCTLLMLDADQF